MQGFNKGTRMVGIVAAALMSVAIGAGGAQAYPKYNDEINPIGMGAGCVDCHGDFQSVGSLHNSHVLNFGITLSPLAPQFTTRCNVCHTDGGGSTPVYTMGSNAVSFGNAGGGFGCAGCHGQDYGETAITAPYNGDPKASGYGLRLVHAAAGVTVCATCHVPNPFPVLDETVRPPYYPMHISDLRNPCDSAQEDLPYDNDMFDTVGLDNDGNGFADYPADPNCPLPTTTTSTTSTTTTTLPVTCDVSPQGVCTAAEKAKLSVNEKTAGKQKVKFQLTKLVPMVAKADFGAPVLSDTSYALCVYNAANALVGSYEVARGSDTCGTDPCWENFKDTGFAYADKDLLSADGISKIQLVGGDAGKGKVKLQGSNKASTLPTGIAALLSGAASATAQLVTSDGECFGMPLPTVKKNDGLQFSAQAP